MQFFISFCTGCILIGALCILCPDGNISKPVKYVFSLIFLIIIISAANIPFKQIDFSAFSPATSINTEQMEINSAKYVFSHALTSAEINFSRIDIFTDKSDDDSIIITKVAIATDHPREQVIKALGILAENREVEVINE